MACKIYVGNYPLSFNKEDVLNLFQDYEGVELAGFFRNKNKCYSFLLCLDERQLIEIVANLHDIDVCGRNLIVRAADEKFQQRIEQSMLEHGIVSVHPRNTCRVNTSAKTLTSSGNRHFKKSVKPQTVDSESRNLYSKKSDMCTSDYQSVVPNTYKYSEKNNGVFKNSNHDSFTHFSAHNSPNSYCQSVIESEREKAVLAINPQETFSKVSKLKADTSSARYKTMNERFDSYKRKATPPRENGSSAGFQTTNVREQNKPRTRNASESSLETIHNIPSVEQHENLSFVSIMNFPLRLPVRNLYELFEDFQPLKVFVICNEPRKDKTPTEAIVCFGNEKDATEAILTLDNTVYCGRILLVTDAVDESLISELLSFGLEE